MADFSATPLLVTGSASVWDVVCAGECRHRSAEECAAHTHLVFPYRGVYVHHSGRREAVAETQQVVFINGGEGYHISHPVDGGDASLSVSLSAPLLEELAPREHLAGSGEVPAFAPLRLRVDPSVQGLAALLRHRLAGGQAEPLEGESLTVELVRRAVGERTAHVPGASAGLQKLADRAKLALASDLARRWTLAEVAAEVGVSPIYLTQVFQKVEGVPLYRYQLQLRLAQALDLLAGSDDLTMLGLDLGFSSHSHFTSAFRRMHGSTPAAFRQAVRGG